MNRATIIAMSNYLVATYSARKTPIVRDTPAGKVHAYLPDQVATVCGFGLAQMQRFKELRFAGQPHQDRCSICDRRIRAAGR